MAILGNALLFPTVPSFIAIIHVVYPNGAILTCSLGSTVYTATTTTGSYTFKVYSAGTWVVTATLDGESVSADVVITEDGQTEDVELSLQQIYGISRDITSSSPVWTRTDAAVGMTATASVGTSAGSSDFDSCYPWSDIARETLSTGDVMVKIPKFWYRRYREGNIEHIQITNKETEGFTLHPAFNHAGIPKDCIYVGAYKAYNAGENVMGSASGKAPLVGFKRYQFRMFGENRGEGFYMIDIATLSAIQMLMLVEFANNDMQSAIGRGYCDGNTAAIKTGSCDNVPNLTGRPAGTDGKTDVVWRGIEGFWGNVWEWVDGVNWVGGTYYVCNDPSKYADDTGNNYTTLSYTGATNWANSYITVEGFDTGENVHIMLPAVAGSGSATTYQCDACWSSTGWEVFIHGGYWVEGSQCGLFTASFGNGSSNQGTTIGSRLMYIPS